MLVDVVRMRREGVKLTEFQLKDARKNPARGDLVLRLEDWRPHNEPSGKPEKLTVASLWTVNAYGGREGILPTLRQARIEKVEGEHFIVLGIESIGAQTVVWRDYPQAWLCTLARADELPGEGAGERFPASSAGRWGGV